MPPESAPPQDHDDPPVTAAPDKRTNEQWAAIIADMVALCPGCWAPHRSENYTCAVSHGWYTCSACASRYTMSEFVTSAQYAALQDAVKAAGPQHYKDFTEADTRGISGVVIRQSLRADGWTFPVSEYRNAT